MFPGRAGRAPEHPTRFRSSPPLTSTRLPLRLIATRLPNGTGRSPIIVRTRGADLPSDPGAPRSTYRAPDPGAFSGRAAAGTPAAPLGCDAAPATAASAITPIAKRTLTMTRTLPAGPRAPTRAPSPGASASSASTSPSGVALGLDVNRQADLAGGLARDRADRDDPRRAGNASARRLDEVADGRGRGEGDVVGLGAALDLLVGSAPRAPSRRGRRRRPRRRARAAPRAARRGPRRRGRSAPAGPRRHLASASTSDSATSARDDVGDHAAVGERARGAGTDRRDLRLRQRAGVEARRPPSPRTAARHRVRAGQADERVGVEGLDRRRDLVACRSAARSGSRAARRPRRRARRGVAPMPLAWARARVTTTRLPCSGRRSSQAIASRRAATGPKSEDRRGLEPGLGTAAGERRQRRRRRSAGPAGCRARPRPRARPGRARRRSGAAAISRQVLHAHVEDERAREAGERLPVDRRLGLARDPRGR